MFVVPPERQTVHPWLYQRKRISNDPKDKAMIRFNGLIQDGVMPRQQFWHLLRMLLRKFRAAFNIGEKKSYCTGGERYIASNMDDLL